MKKLRILFAVLLVVAPMLALFTNRTVIQAQSFTFPTQPQATIVLAATASTANTSWLNLSNSSAQDVHYWTLTWYAFTGVGTIPTCQVKVQQSIDQSTITDLIANQTCTTTGTVTTSSAAETNYVRISLGTKTGTGTVVVVANGYRENPYSSQSVSILGSFVLSQGTVTSNMTGQISTQIVGLEGVSSYRYYLTSCTTVNNSTTVSTTVYIEDGQNGNVIYPLPAPASAIGSTGGGGATVNFGQFGLKIPTSGNGVFARNATTGSSTNVACNGARSTESR